MHIKKFVPVVLAVLLTALSAPVNSTFDISSILNIVKAEDSSDKNLISKTKINNDAVTLNAADKASQSNIGTITLIEPKEPTVTDPDPYLAPVTSEIPTEQSIIIPDIEEPIVPVAEETVIVMPNKTTISDRTIISDKNLKK